MNDKRYNEMLDYIGKGATLVVSNYINATQIESKHIKRWKELGINLITNSKQDGFYIAKGKSKYNVTGSVVRLYDSKNNFITVDYRKE